MHIRKTTAKLKLILYPFVAGAVAINLFLLSLLLQAVGVPVMAPIHALLASIPLGVPAVYVTAHWVQGLIDQAEGRG